MKLPAQLHCRSHRQAINMRLGIGIGLNIRANNTGAKIVEGDPFASISVHGQYDSVESAQSSGAGSGAYFVTTADNIYGLPAAILMRVPTYTGYISSRAGYNAVTGNVVFQLSSGNVHGYPGGVSMITYPSDDYSNDTQASSGGIALNGLYALSSSTFGKLIKQRTA